MGIIQLDAYVLLLSGHDRYSFLDGLSTNKVDHSCSTVLTPHLQKSSMLLMLLKWARILQLLAMDHTRKMFSHIYNPRILQQNVTIRDISSLNNVYVSTEEYPATQEIDNQRIILGWIIVSHQRIILSRDNVNG